MLDISSYISGAWRCLPVVCLTSRVRWLGPPDRRRSPSGSRAQVATLAAADRSDHHDSPGRSRTATPTRCTGTSAAGALELATSGNWSGKWFRGLGYSVETIAGETSPVRRRRPANFFWSFWLDNKPADHRHLRSRAEPRRQHPVLPRMLQRKRSMPAGPQPARHHSAPAVAEVGSPVT